jgi:hypothetical protein
MMCSLFFVAVSADMDSVSGVSEAHAAFIFTIKAMTEFFIPFLALIADMDSVSRVSEAYAASILRIKATTK